MRAIESHYDSRSRNQIVGRGSGGDLTLKIDQVSEKAIFRSLQRDLGNDSFVFFSEELGEISRGGVDSPVIICDPLDGSHNAQVGVPLFSISLAVIDLGGDSHSRRFDDVSAAHIQNIATGDEYYALKSRGAFQNRKRIGVIQSARPSSEHTFNTLAIECGDIQFIAQIVSRFAAKDVYKLRILGSAAISLCLVASGSIDALAFVQRRGARTIDSAAGYLIAKEAGCWFSDLSGKIKDVGECKISFDSRINLGVAHSRRKLRSLEILLRSVMK